MRKGIRIQKIIAESGVLSRRKAEIAITAGRIAVDGETVRELGSLALPSSKITLDGILLPRRLKLTVVALNKPPFIVTTKSDPEGRKTVMDFIGAPHQHLKPVGRLDFGTTGLLLLTDDGDLANRLTHPSLGVHKMYEVTTYTPLTEKSLSRLLEGVELTDGIGKFESVSKLRETSRLYFYEVRVSEGRNRFVRRMFDAVGSAVSELKRTQIGSLKLSALKLQPGESRVLTQAECSLLEIR